MDHQGSAIPHRGKSEDDLSEDEGLLANVNRDLASNTLSLVESSTRDGNDLEGLHQQNHNSFKSPYHRACSAVKHQLHRQRERIFVTHLYVEEKFHHVFGRLGGYVADRPLRVMLLMLFLVVICGLGILKIDFHPPIEKVWVPKESIARVQSEFVFSTFGDYRTVSIIMKANPNVGAENNPDVLRKDVLLEAMRIHDAIISTPLLWKDGRNYTFDKICLKPLPFVGCVIQSVLDYWSFDMQKLEDDPDPHSTVSQDGMKGVLFNPLNVSRLLGGIKRDPQTSKILSAEVAVMNYVTQNNEAIRELVKEWELLFLNITSENYAKDNVLVYRQAKRSSEDEINRATKEDIPLFGVSFVLMLLYCSFALGKMNVLQSKALLGFSGVISILLAMIMSFGICGYLGVYWSSAVVAVPFLVLGIGTDDMFIIVNAFERTENSGKTIRERLSSSLAIVGTSISMTSLTDFIAFLVGAWGAKLPALTGFCLFSGISILCDFLLQVTFFVGCMVLNERRMEQNRVDCFPCVVLPTKQRGNCCTIKKQSNSVLSDFVRKYYATKILKPKVRIVLIGISLFMFVGSLIAATQISSGVSQDDVMPDESYVKEFNILDNKYFAGFNLGTDIILGTFDYSDEPNQDYILDLAERVAQSKYINPPVRSWLHDYLDWLQTSWHNDSLTEKGRPPDSKTFYLWLYEFLAEPTRGMAYSSDIVFQFGAIKASKMTTKHRIEVLETDFQRAECVKEMRKLTQDSPIPAFIFSWRYIPWDQYIGMVESNLVQFSLVAVAILLIVIFFLGDIPTSVVTMAALVVIDVDLLGMMYFWNIPLSNVSMINLLLSLGLAVDACAHVAHSVNLEIERQIHEKLASRRLEKEEKYPPEDSETALRKEKHTPDDEENKEETVELDRSAAVIEGLSNIGASVFSGTFTSFLGILSLGVANHGILRTFFKFYFSIFLFALFHGLTIVPIILSMLPSKISTKVYRKYQKDIERLHAGQ